MGEREWMHEPDTSGSAGNRLAQRMSTTQWLSGTKFIKLVAAVVIIGLIAIVAAARLG